MKHIYCFLLAIHFCSAAAYAVTDKKNCDPKKQFEKKTDTPAVKKSPVKIAPAPAVQQTGKTPVQKEEKKTGGDFITPLGWRPSFL